MVIYLQILSLALIIGNANDAGRIGTLRGERQNDQRRHIGKHLEEGLRDAARLEGLQRLPDQVAQILVPENLAKIEEAAEAFSHNHDVFFIGRNLDSATCLEGSLKLKEIAYVHSEAYPAGELKHGPISLIEEETLVVALATVEKLFDKTMANVREVKARGAHVLGVTTEDFAGEIEKYADRSLIVPKTHPLLQPSLTVIPLQAFAYYIALARGCDVDMPRNLAKSVTVE